MLYILETAEILHS